MKLIALDWDTRQLRVVIANHQGGKTSIEDVRSIGLLTDDAVDEDGNSHKADSDRADSFNRGGYDAQLQQALNLPELRARNAESLVAVRRGDVELRLLNLPPLPASEVPEIVRMQALREFSELSDDWPLDYLTLHADGNETTVLSAAISPVRLSNYRTRLEDAEQRAAAMVLRPTATALIVSQLDELPRPTVEVCIEDLGHAFEVSVLREGTPVLIRTVQAPQSEDYDRVTFLAAEIRRTSLAARNQLHGDATERIVMFGTAENDRKIGDQLQQRLDLPVRLLDPFSVLPTSKRLNLQSIDNPGQFAAAIGMLAGHNAQDGLTSPLIDFLNPRKAPPPKSNKNLVLGVITASLLVVFLGISWFVLHLRGLDEQAQQAQRTIQNRTKVMASAQARLDEIAEINHWVDSRVDWMELMSDVSSRLPDAENARVERWQANSLTNGDGQLVLEGIVDDQGTIAALDAALRRNDREVVGFGGEFEDRDKELPWRFKQTLTLKTEAGKKAATEATPVAITNANFTSVDDGCIGDVRLMGSEETG